MTCINEFQIASIVSRVASRFLRARSVTFSWTLRKIGDFNVTLARKCGVSLLSSAAVASQSASSEVAPKFLFALGWAPPRERRAREAAAGAGGAGGRGRGRRRRREGPAQGPALRRASQEEARAFWPGSIVLQPWIALARPNARLAVLLSRAE